MHWVLLCLLVAAVGTPIQFLVTYLIRQWNYAAKAKQLGCQDAPAHPDGGFMGRKIVSRMFKADKEQLLPDLILEFSQEMHRATGRICETFSLNILGQKVYVTIDPKNIQALLATQFDDYDLGPARRGNMIRTLGDGIFVQDGKPWEHSRQMLRPSFVREQVADLDLEERHVQHLMQVLPVNNDGWTPKIDLLPLFFRLTIDSACEFLFGESVDSQLVEAGLSTKTLAHESDFSKAFDAAQKHMAVGFRMSDKYWLHNPRDYREQNKIINDFVKHYVERALQRRASGKKLHEGRYIFSDAIAEQTQDPEVIRAQLLNILLAGRDTTASLLSWLFKELVRHPEVFHKLRATILDTFGTYENPHNITFSTLKGCQYLQYCLNETLRVWPVVPGNARRSNKPTTLPRGGGPDGTSPIFIPPETDVQYYVHVMHRRKDLWGPDADQFKPERFEGRRPGWEFLPFNGGPRICIGQQFALTEAGYVTVRLLQRFDALEGAPEELAESPLRSNLTLTSCPGLGVRLRMHEAARA